ncbi:hypothetical protein [Pedobacter africanus]|uniref:hypothetical protein n=1 Tax=Pedobacter africanus TaxID=151894 RepID=UPI000A066257|nr:hypothetical protein [Pedobacter africanus]
MNTLKILKGEVSERNTLKTPSTGKLVNNSGYLLGFIAFALANTAACYNGLRPEHRLYRSQYLAADFAWPYLLSASGRFVLVAFAKGLGSARPARFKQHGFTI